MMETFKLKDEYIKLGQLLKAVGIADSGMTAKMLILDGKVLVNGQAELRRGKKLKGEDVVSCNGQEIKIIQ